MRIVLASRNPGKVREFAGLLAAHTVLALPDDVRLPPEDRDSFDEHALAKARAACAHTALPALGDDSGLQAAALGGRPGVRSARFAGEHATDGENVERLLALAPAGSPLRFVCALALVYPDGRELLVHGHCDGTLAHAPRGERGFGYDPVFIPASHPGRTMAQLTHAEKHAVSHRGAAVRALLAQLS